MQHFHPLIVSRVSRETSDSVRIALAVPTDLRQAFRFLPGQHVAIEMIVDGERLRRTYSLCSQPDDPCLEIGVRVQPGGRLSTFLAKELKPGDEISAMPPLGRFHVDADERKQGHAPRTVVLFAAGSGITPILSILTSTLAREADTRAIVFYGNRSQRSTMFIDDLFALKNRYADRLELHFLFSREAQEFELMGGRLDGEKTMALWAAFVGQRTIDAVYVCGPDTMIGDVTAAVTDIGLPAASIHSERFGVPGQAVTAPKVESAAATDDVAVTLVMDGHRRSFSMNRADSLVDGAEKHGIELPYSCKGGVCATCRTHLRGGRVRMDVNYGLEPWEVEEGFILACQSHPESSEIELDYDRT